jgi:hypothetical protein
MNNKYKYLSLLGLVCCNAQAASVLANSNFEAFSISDPGYNTPYVVVVNPNGYLNDYGGVRIYPQTVANMGWETTAPETGPPIEIWTSGAYSQNSSSGTGQFAELNAFSDAALFQDVTIPVAGLVDYSFEHKGRAGNDTLKVLITYLGVNNTYEGGTGFGDDLTVVNQNFTTGSAAWSLYSQADQFTSVAGGSYRFSFGSVSTEGGNPSVGNFLDNVNFGVDAIPEPSAALLGSLGMLALLRRRNR